MTEDKTRLVAPRESSTRRLSGRRVSASEVDSLAGSAPPSSIPPGTLLIHTYRVERLLGSGGMGEVYLARHTGLGTWHAVKVIRPELFSNRQALDLFRREATVLRGVRHDAVVSYDGFFRDETGREYLVMEYVEGPSLSDWLKRGPLSPKEIFALRDRLAEGLAQAHRKGAVHRDVSPDNVIVPEGRIERAKLIDFGLCKLSDPTQKTIVGSTFAGKYRFASPEQLGLFGGKVDTRSDIYSLGLVLAAAATGRALDMGTSFDAVVQARRSVPDLTAVPDWLHEQLAALLQPNPAERPQILLDLMRLWPTPSLSLGTDGPQQLEVSEGVGARTGERKTGARRWLVAAGTGVALLSLSVGVYRLFGPLEPVDEETVDVGQEKKLPTVVPHLDELTRMPWNEIAPHFRDWVARGRIDDAFSLLRHIVAEGRMLPAEETYRFATELKERGRIDEAFALLKVIANDGHGAAALAVGEMYDPVLWTPVSSPFSTWNPRKAQVWYQRALDGGAGAASSRLEALENWTPE